MNEATQLEAMKAELLAAGYEPVTDMTLGELGFAAPLVGSDGMRLDLVGKRKDRGEADPDRPGPDRPGMVVIEIANRTRETPDQRGRRRPRFTDEEEAVHRFGAISQAIAERPDIAFEIRFFDVSADQAAARQLKRGFSGKETMEARIRDARRLLITASGRDDLSRGLVVARLWAHWVRIAGTIHPGRERRELKTADLRTIQKDLFDQKVLLMLPANYAPLHRALLAAFEGGDVEPRRLLDLEPQVQRLLDWAAERYGVADAEMPEETGDLFSRVLKAVEERSSGGRREELQAATMMMYLMQSSSELPREVVNFLIALGREPLLPDDLMTELLERANNAPSAA
ncbi:hypothetical protein FIM10_18530 [Sphingomonadales bacterium 56]|uniref:Uncharacterized protein n=1 Tax=Sphingobium indicum (strain DSM 16412 / CCM 7286 / MTCC 6364 / B90A) TaxID=861109 RepID=A0A1L5BRV2_SPHIB|nr:MULTISPECIES: hypothetical protein [Sphingobium]MBY2930679.1 hypothetical protein [Sphingomonadales bacterium 56]MBY2960779.1 hypothetical protein [Sphingomonadales bacterium 58]APL95517.1 hypothetical protein SIDU_13905 [Sphingobium indicum B90A]CAD7341741.1 hypothetical protein SPHS6_03729 [Sphingobium sp. S6]CAD7341928.1 hypothetical protein SPHS8_03761 [Sphingobium sp. S8]